jgi:osmoprotectant transport system permease protein
MPDRLFTAAANPWFSLDYIRSSGNDLIAALGQHLYLTFASVLIATVIAVPLAVVAVRVRGIATPMLITAGVLYTIPALALITGLWPIFGLSTTTVIVALAIYSLLLILRNAIVGLQSVPAEIYTAARGMGFGPTHMLVRVGLPIALPAVMSGIRLATVSTVGLVMIGALVGHGGLGSIVLNGFINNFYRAPIVAGTILTVALALILEWLLSRAQHAMTPWSQS